MPTGCAVTTISRSPAATGTLRLDRKRLGAGDRLDEADDGVVAVGAGPRRVRPEGGVAGVDEEVDLDRVRLLVLEEAAGARSPRRLEEDVAGGHDLLVGEKSAPVPTEGVGRKQPT